MLSEQRVRGRTMCLALLVAVLIAGRCPSDLAPATMPMGPDCPPGRCSEQIACRQPVLFQARDEDRSLVHSHVTGTTSALGASCGAERAGVPA